MTWVDQEIKENCARRVKFQTYLKIFKSSDFAFMCVKDCSKANFF